MYSSIFDMAVWLLTDLCCYVIIDIPDLHDVSEEYQHLKGWSKLYQIYQPPEIAGAFT